jgi:quinol monooxygenase YgiN
MTATELAIVHILPGTTADSSTLLSALKTAKATQESLSGYPAYYLTCIEDPSLVYILGSWFSPAAHADAIASPQNQAMLELLGPLIDRENITMYHIGLESLEDAPLSAPVISVSQHFIKHNSLVAFASTFDRVVPLLGDYTAPQPTAGGYRLEKEQREDGSDKEEFVFFSGWDSIEHYSSFTHTDEFTTYRGIVEFVDGFEIKYLRRLDV